MAFHVGTVLVLVLALAVCGLGVYLTILLIRALRRYLGAAPAREERKKTARSLGEVLRAHRTACKMTQEFVAEQLGVSRQAVSKWESGASDPNTANLVALAKLFGVAPEELLREAQA